MQVTCGRHPQQFPPPHRRNYNEMSAPLAPASAAALAGCSPRSSLPCLAIDHPLPMLADSKKIPVPMLQGLKRTAQSKWLCGMHAGVR